MKTKVNFRGGRGKVLGEVRRIVSLDASHGSGLERKFNRPPSSRVASDDSKALRTECAACLPQAERSVRKDQAEKSLLTKHRSFSDFLCSFERKIPDGKSHAEFVETDEGLAFT